jgi:DNA-binding transcriptional LysR family regulator
MPTKDNISEHAFIDSIQYSAKAEPWAPWRAIVERAFTVYTSDSPSTYAMMVRSGLGTGLLSSVNSLNSSSVICDLDCTVNLPLYLTSLTERLQSRPVRIVYDFVASVLGDANPWLADEVDLTIRDIDYITSYQTIVNG